MKKGFPFNRSGGRLFCFVNAVLKRNKNGSVVLNLIISLCATFLFTLMFRVTHYFCTSKVIVDKREIIKWLQLTWCCLILYIQKIFRFPVSFEQMFTVKIYVHVLSILVFNSTRVLIVGRNTVILIFIALTRKCHYRKHWLVSNKITMVWLSSYTFSCLYIIILTDEYWALF